MTAEGRRRYEGRVVAVTGGGSGLGEAMCLAFSREGARVAALDVRLGAAKRVAGACEGGARPYRCDVSDPVSVREAFADFGAAMRSAPLRFYAVEHLIAMVAALALVHVGVARSRKAEGDATKHRMAAIFFTAAMVLMRAVYDVNGKLLGDYLPFPKPKPGEPFGMTDEEREALSKVKCMTREQWKAEKARAAAQNPAESQS